jgi:hypothetical protein
MSTQSDRFTAGISEWRKLIATVPADARLGVFTNAASDIASYVSKGFDKTTAVDELADMAAAHGLGDVDTVQTIIADGFREAELRIGDFDEVPKQQPPPRGNGQQQPALRILTKAEFIKGFVPPDYLIEGLLQRRFVYSLTGQTGHAKTAVALLIARLVSCSDYNTTLGPHRVDKGRVIYFVGENPDDVRMRVIGSDAGRKDDPQNDTISFIAGVFNIEQMFKAIEAQIARSGDVSLIVVDTSAAYFLGNEELSNTQMGAYARLLRRLTTMPGGPTVLVLCHPIKHVLEPSQLLPRGGGAYLAEMDANLTLWRLTDEVVELYFTKNRGPAFQPISFRLETIRTDALRDRKGRQIPTVQAVPISLREEEAQTAQAESDEDRVLSAMLKLKEGSFARWAEFLGWVSDSGSPYRKKVERCIGRLAKAKLATEKRGHWCLTEKGEQEARKAALRFEAAALATDQRDLDL